MNKRMEQWGRASLENPLLRGSGEPQAQAAPTLGNRGPAAPKAVTQAHRGHRAWNTQKIEGRVVPEELNLTS